VQNNQGILGTSISAGVHASAIKGLGVSVGYNLLPILHINAGYSYLKLGSNSKLIKPITDNVNTGGTDFEINLNSIDLMAEVYPFGPLSGLNVTVGAHFMLNDLIDVSGSLDPGDTFDFGDVELAETSTTVANNISAKFKANSVAPYIGIGFGRAVPKGRVSFGMKAGIFFIGKPKAELSTTNITPNINGTIVTEQEAEEAMNDEINDNLPVKFLPSLSFRIMVKLKS